MRKLQKTTKTKKELFIKAFQSTLNISKACQKAKISRDVYYQWLRKDPQFEKDVNEALESVIDSVENKLFEIANLGDLKDATTLNSIKMILAKNRGYTDKVDKTIEHKGEGITIVIEEKDEKEVKK